VLGGTSYLLDVGIATAATIAAVVTAVKGYLRPGSFRNGGGAGPAVPRLPHLGSQALQQPHLSHALGTVLRGSSFMPLTSVHASVIPPLALVGVALTTAPLAFRRTYPTAAFCVVVLAFIGTDPYISPTAITVAATLVAAYFAVVYGKNRWAALGCLVTGAVIVTVKYPNIGGQVPSRLIPAVVLLTTVALGYLMRMWQLRARDSAARLVRAEAEHQAATSRAVAEERARIAAELHDVVTHNVSVMVVQAGAGRRVLDSSPADTREALIEIEASGRTAMTELRHLLGLLAPSAAQEPDTSGAPAGQDMLRPQPGLAEVPALCARVRAAGLPVELSVTGTQRGLPQGLNLAAYRVVQEALTNVIKHADRARTRVRIGYRAHDLVIDVSNDGGVLGGAAPVSVAIGSGSGRGLIGLRERIAIYGGSLDVGPRPGGGWRVRATIPREQAEVPARISLQGLPA
jgi:signal transduction histidine kinase